MKLAYDVYQPEEDSSKQRSEEVHPIIMVHGMCDSKRMWRELAPAIAKATGRTVYAVDMRNHGDSPCSKEINEMNFIIDLLQFIDDHGIPKAVFLGHSLGGRFIMSLALLKPEKVEKLIVEDMSLISTKYFKRMWANFLQLFKVALGLVPPGSSEEEAKGIMRDYLQNYSTADKSSAISSTNLLGYLDAMEIKKVGDRYEWNHMDLIEKVVSKNSDLDLNIFHSKVYTGEMLLLYGSETFTNVAKDTLIPKFFPKVRKVCIEGADHYLHKKHLKEVQDLMIKFLSN